jgi:bifunctional DNase/RNase
MDGRKEGRKDILEKKEGNVMHRLKALCLLACVALSLGGCRTPDAELLAVDVKGVIIDPETQSPILFLVDPDSDRGLPVWIGLNEARAITLGLEKVTPPRPLTHDLMKRMLDLLNATVDRVVISDLKDNTYYATLSLRAGRNTWEVDSRPSDAVAIALKYDAPLFLSRELVQMGVLVDLGSPSSEASLEGLYGFVFQELSPEVARYFGFKKEEGVIVTEVRADSPAEKAGMQKGDILVGLDREAVAGREDVRRILKEKGEASSVRVEVYRKGKVRLLKMKP